MFKIKLIFSVVVLIITGLVIISFLGFNTDLEELKYTSPVIAITSYSDEAFFYSDIEMKKPLELKDVDFSKDQGIMTPQQIAVELLFKDLFIEMKPLSYTFFSVSKKTLSLVKGEFYWNRIKKGATEVTTKTAEYTLYLSGKGRVRVDDKGNLTIWNFRGSSKVVNKSGEFELNPGRFYLFTDRGSLNSEKIPPAPEFIDPKEKKIFLKGPKDTVVKLECKAVSSAAGFVFRIYDSPLRENLLSEKKTVVNRTSVDLADFEGKRIFYWNVSPLNENEREGEPSETGFIKLFGASLAKDLDKKPPELNIISLTVNGNLVLIKGKADPDATLFIDDTPVPLEQDGSFIYTRSFKSLGLKTLTFRLVSAAEVENIVTRQITIFEE